MLKASILVCIFISSVSFAEYNIPKIVRYSIKTLGMEGKHYLVFDQFVTAKCVVDSIIAIESGGRYKVKTYEKKVDDYSYGLMQVLCSTAREWGFKEDCELLLNPWWNVYYGTKYIRYKLRRYKGDGRKRNTPATYDILYTKYAHEIR